MKIKQFWGAEAVFNYSGICWRSISYSQKYLQAKLLLTSRAKDLLKSLVKSEVPRQELPVRFTYTCKSEFFGFSSNKKHEEGVARPRVHDWCGSSGAFCLTAWTRDRSSWDSSSLDIPFHDALDRLWDLVPLPVLYNHCVAASRNRPLIDCWWETLCCSQWCIQ